MGLYSYEHSGTVGSGSQLKILNGSRVVVVLACSRVVLVTISTVVVVVGSSATSPPPQAENIKVNTI